MNKDDLIFGFKQLTPENRRDLLEELLAAVEEDEAYALTSEQMAEVHRRMEEHKRDPSSAIPWEEVRDRLRACFE